MFELDSVFLSFSGRTRNIKLGQLSHRPGEAPKPSTRIYCWSFKIYISQGAYSYTHRSRWRGRESERLMFLAGVKRQPGTKRINFFCCRALRERTSSNRAQLNCLVFTICLLIFNLINKFFLCFHFFLPFPFILPYLINHHRVFFLKLLSWHSINQLRFRFARALASPIDLHRTKTIKFLPVSNCSAKLSRRRESTQIDFVGSVGVDYTQRRRVSKCMGTTKM